MKKFIISIIILVIILILGEVGLFYLFLSSKNSSQKTVKAPPPQQQTTAPVKIVSPEEQMKIINDNYPLVLKGTIKFFDNKTTYKATLQTDDGKTYLLWPAQPQALYEAFGARNGGKVQLNGKPIEDGKLLWALMKGI